MEVAKGFTDVLYTTMVLLFNEIFVPVMTEILSMFYEKAMYVLSHSVSILAYFFLITVCKILDSLETKIGIFAGTENVIVDNKPMTFMEMVFNQDAVSKGFLMITLVAVGICFLFTIFAIVRSMSSSTLENKNPISQVLKDAMKACVSFMLVPFLCIALMQLSSALIKQTKAVIQAESGTAGDPSMGLYIFLTASLRAGRADFEIPVLQETADVAEGLGDKFTYEILTSLDSAFRVEYLPPSMSDDLRRSYLNGDKDYLDFRDSGSDFSAAKIDYLLGFSASIFMVIMLAGVLIQFIRRLLELVLLYLVAPFFVATIPLDRGDMFKRWREMFIAKFLAGFGVIYALKIFMLLLPLIFSDNLSLGSSFVMDRLYAGGVYDQTKDKFFDNLREKTGEIEIPGSGNPAYQEEVNRMEEAVDFAWEKTGMGYMENHSAMDSVLVNMGLMDRNSPSLEESMIDSILKTIFFLGGMFAVYKSCAMFLEILNPKAAEDAKTSTMLAMGYTVGAARKAAATGVQLGVAAGVGLGTGLATGGAGAAATAGAAGAKTAATAGAKAVGTAAKTAGSTAKNAVKSAAKSTAKNAVGAAKQGVQGAASGAAGAAKDSGDRDG